MVIHLHHVADHRFWRAELDEDGVLFIVEGRMPWLSGLNLDQNLGPRLREDARFSS